MNSLPDPAETGETDMTIEEFDEFLFRGFKINCSLMKEIEEGTSSQEGVATWCALAEYFGLWNPDTNNNDGAASTSTKEKQWEDEPFATFEVDPYFSDLDLSESDSSEASAVATTTLLKLEVDFQPVPGELKPMMDLYLAINDDFDEDDGLDGSPAKRSKRG